MKFITLVMLSTLISCAYDNGCSTEYSHSKREEMFFKCMESLPAGPNQVKYNDWDEVVSECGNQASRMAYITVCQK